MPRMPREQPGFLGCQLARAPTHQRSFSGCENGVLLFSSFPVTGCRLSVREAKRLQSKAIEAMEAVSAEEALV